MDTMVTARMSAGKKEVGAAVLKELGVSASEAINQLYDHLIAERRLPWDEVVTSRGNRSSMLAQAIAQVDAIPRISTEPGFEGMTTHQARLARLGLDGSDD